MTCLLFLCFPLNFFNCELKQMGYILFSRTLLQIAGSCRWVVLCGAATMGNNLKRASTEYCRFSYPCMPVIALKICFQNSAFQGKVGMLSVVFWLACLLQTALVKLYFFLRGATKSLWRPIFVCSKICVWLFLFYHPCIKIYFFLNHKVAYFIINERELSESIDTFMQMFGKIAEVTRIITFGNVFQLPWWA